jgi:hypothetical protein
LVTLNNDYILGLDLGKEQDPTALALIEDDYCSDHLMVRALHRYPLGTPLTDLPGLLKPRLTSPPLAGQVRLAVDASGLGGPIVDLLRQQLRSIDLYAITITSGNNIGGNHKNPHVPKQDLIATTIVHLEQGLLRIASDMPETRTLRDELLSFRRTTTEHGNDTYAAKTGQHDDLVIALSLALWLNENRGIGFLNTTNSVVPRGEIPGIVPMGDGIL